MLQYTCISIYVLRSGDLEEESQFHYQIHLKYAQLDPPISVFIYAKGRMLSQDIVTFRW